jgi:hypothetical protein
MLLRSRGHRTDLGLAGRSDAHRLRTLREGSVPVRTTRSYGAYSLGVGVVWAVLLVLAAVFAPAGKRRNVRVVFAGFALGWVSATIARYVYPPPKKYRRPQPQQPA